MFVPRNTTIRYSKREDLIEKRGDLTLGNKFGGGFDEFMEARLNVEQANQPERRFRKMQTGRIDYFISGLDLYRTAYLTEHNQEHEFITSKPPKCK